MEKRKLLRTIESAASKNFKSENELLREVILQIVETDHIDITGGRLWQLDSDKHIYKLVYQTGNVTKISEDFTLKVEDYHLFEEISKERTILSEETNEDLIQKGITKYSASGIGNKVKTGDKSYYEYVLAVNSENIDEDLRYNLNIIATVLTARIREIRVSDSRQNLIYEIDNARKLQKSILPEHEYKFHDYDLFGVTVSADTIGGDFFDYLKIGDTDERLGIVLGDAASKGLSAAAEAMYISGAIRMASTFEIKISPFMHRINMLVNKIFSDDKFATLFYCEISDDKRGLMLYANAGHNPPMFYNTLKNNIIYLNPTGPLLGPAPNSRYETNSINFNPGDILVIYSDGIVEAANHEFDFYEEKRLEEIIKTHKNETPRTITYAILEDVAKFSSKNSKYQDDKTVVVIKKKKQ